MSGGEIAAVEHALERLFRLTVSRSIHKRQTEAVGSSVTRPGYAILRTLDESDAVSLGELANACSMDPAAASRQVRALEDEGLVRRETNEDDGRVVTLRLTPRGRTIYRRVVQVRTAHMQEVMAMWSPADRATLAALVDRLVDDLKAVPFRPATKGKAHADA